MKILNKILISIFVILLIVIVVEIGYFFYSKSLTQNNTQANRSDTQVANPPPATKTTQTLANSPYNPGSLNIAFSTKKGSLTSSVLTNTYEGRIKKIDLSGGVTQTLKYQYKALLVLQGNNGVTNNFYYNENSLSKLIITEKNGDQEKPISISNLKVDDTIIVKESVDLTKNADVAVIQNSITKVL